MIDVPPGRPEPRAASQEKAQGSPRVPGRLGIPNKHSLAGGLLRATNKYSSYKILTLRTAVMPLFSRLSRLFQVGGFGTRSH